MSQTNENYPKLEAQQEIAGKAENITILPQEIPIPTCDFDDVICEGGCE